ncbi:MAG TPA: sigma-54 dependent transcriptional regulator [Thermoanaerobaculia bacterium]|nr:sigma-54 dependent transcriptional regulator [Thermoanaerobaculia bacterium]HRR13526.1 sigma-54 dependent transcriptional regulator [Thermoanaerobaculia bacterium]HRS37000.1 sigma-54 dependent transcriptional regulator [Thermoanaerobaculia bacterium]
MSSSWRASVLVVDDEKAIRDSLRMILEFEDYRVDEAADGDAALRRVAERQPDALLLDIKMPGLDGLAVLRMLRERGHDVPVLMITGHGDVQTAVEATRQGAFDFLEKPLARDRVLLSLRNAVESSRLQREARRQRGDSEELVGSSPAMQRLRETIGLAAPTTATVLVTGESGTGKELVAREIHRLSPRRDRAFVQVNCAAIPDELIESELFGHEKGSFTGAVRKQVGKFVAADGGTIFLDEIGDMSPRTQAKVLRVLQNGEVEPVGAARVVRVDVRVVAATNRDLPADIEAGRFREDLYFRLNVVPVRTPALREHIEDLPVLVDHFVRRFTELQSYRPRRLDDEALAFLKALPWRGNVRELRNLVERLLILAPGPVIDRAAVVAALGAAQPGIGPALFSLPTLREFRDEAERLYLVRKLEENDWNVSQTAQAIDTPRSNLYKKMEQYAIRRPDEAAADD